MLQVGSKDEHEHLLPAATITEARVQSQSSADWPMLAPEAHRHSSRQQHQVPVADAALTAQQQMPAHLRDEAGADQSFASGANTAVPQWSTSLSHTAISNSLDGPWVPDVQFSGTAHGQALRQMHLLKQQHLAGAIIGASAADSASVAHAQQHYLSEQGGLQRVDLIANDSITDRGIQVSMTQCGWLSVCALP